MGQCLAQKLTWNPWKHRQLQDSLGWERWIYIIWMLQGLSGKYNRQLIFPVPDRDLEEDSGVGFSQDWWRYAHKASSFTFKGELILEWKECEGADQLPYRENFSATLTGSVQSRSGDFEKDRLSIFGGCDENGKATNDLYLFNLSKAKIFCYLTRNEIIREEKDSKNRASF